MAITNATRLADFGSGIGTQGAVIQVDNTNQRVGIGTTNPQAMLQVGAAVTVYGDSGIVSATSYYGDGSNLDGVTASGLGTALSDEAGTFLNQIYTTPRNFPVAAGTSVSVESNTGDGNMAFSKLGVIHVGTGATFHVGSGTTLLMNVLSLF
tara:strand:- start:2491 stop:2946 length:456 start_codon:yes stop_codon:yes gene_type:complete